MDKKKQEVKIKAAFKAFEEGKMTSKELKMILGGDTTVVNPPIFIKKVDVI